MNRPPQIIITPRLVLIPLTINQFHDFIFNISILEKTLGLSYQGNTLSPEFLEALQKRYIRFLKERNQAFFNTLWLICLPKEKTIIGNIAYKGKPNLDGVIEIAYSLGLKYRKQGYMIEAVYYFTETALKFPSVKSILAVTHQNNNASINVLQKSNFFYTKSSGVFLYWTKSLSSIHK